MKHGRTTGMKSNDTTWRYRCGFCFFATKSQLCPVLMWRTAHDVEDITCFLLPLIFFH